MTSIVPEVTGAWQDCVHPDALLAILIGEGIRQADQAGLRGMPWQWLRRYRAMRH
jgi:hypothetical protein